MYILDSDIINYFVKGLSDHLRYMINEKYSAKVLTTVCNYAEIMYGLAKFNKITVTTKAIKFMINDLDKLPFTVESAKKFADIKAGLNKNGEILPDLDLMIASIAITNNSILVTNNTKHFSRIKELQLENWL